ncbi:MAG: hypothetical protein WDM70_09965 [Nitrosomonadales bacterium]
MSVQFSDFINSLDPDPLKRGKQFEHFVNLFLADHVGISILHDQAIAA